MPPLNLDIQFLRRPIKPVALALMLSMLSIAWAAFTDVGVLGDTIYSDLLGLGACAVAVILALGWFWRSQPIAQFGLIGAFSIWVLRVALIITVDDNPVSEQGLYLSVAWVVVAGGSYMLEKADSLAISREAGRHGP